jgi:hypothetical protein
MTCSQSAAVAGPILRASLGCARSSSRRGACDWTACVRERWCASDRPWGKISTAGGQPASTSARTKRRAQNDSGRRCRRDSRCRPGARATRYIFLRFIRQRLERRAIDLLEQLASSDARPPGALPLIELGYKLAERGVDVSEADERPGASAGRAASARRSRRPARLSPCRAASSASPAGWRFGNGPSSRHRSG